MNLKSSYPALTIAGLTVVLSACSTATSSTPATLANSPATTTTTTTTTATTTTPTSNAPAKVDPVDKPFRAKMSSLCLAWLADRNKKPAPFYMGNPLAVTREQLPQAASYLDSLAVNHDLVSSTAKLGAPAAGAEAWSTLRSDFEAYQQRQNTAIAAARASDLAAWMTAASAADSARDAILSDLRRGGFLVNDSCQVLFIPGSYHGS